MLPLMYKREPKSNVNVTVALEVEQWQINQKYRTSMARIKM